MGCLEGSGTAVLYIGRTVPKGYGGLEVRENSAGPLYDREDFFLT